MAATNPVAPYVKIDNTSLSFTQYKADIDGNSVAALRIVGQFAPHAQASPNMTIMLDAGSLFDGTTLTEVAAQSTGTITAPAVHPRIDRVVIDNVTGTLTVVPGSEAVSPVPPAIPTGKSPVAQIALTTSTASITNAIIADERNFSALSPGGFGAQASLSSATTCNIGTILSHNVKITGVTTITSFGSSAATTSPIYLIEFSGALTLTDSASLICPGSTDILTAPGDTAVAEYLGSGNWRIRSYSCASGLPLVASPFTVTVSNVPDGFIVDRAYTDITGQQANQFGVIPTDNTTPQDTEGNAILSLSFTPKSATNRLRVRGIGYLVASGSTFTMALFTSASSDAISAGEASVGSATATMLATEVEFVPGTTSPITISMRIGSQSGTAYALNYGSGSAGRTSLVVEEIKAS